MRCAALVAVVFLVSGLIGCGKSDNPPAAAIGQGGTSTAGASGTATPPMPANPASIGSLEPPAQAVYQWLDAIRTGSDAVATAMLTQVARQKALEQDRSVRPAASDTARFQIGSVEYIGEDGARVASKWTDLDESGQLQTDEALWVLRKEADGWRIAGVAATIFDGEPPLLLNFEDPEEMAQKQQWARDEIQRRYEAQQQAQAAGNQPVEGTMMR